MFGFTPLSQSPFSAPSVAGSVVEASASASCSATTAAVGVRVRLGDGAVSASASNTITATRARNIDGAAMSSASSSSGSCERVRQDNQAVSASCTATANNERVRQDNQSVTGTATLVSLSTYSRIRTGGSESMTSTATFTAAQPVRIRKVAVESIGDSSVVTLYERWRLIDRIAVSGNATLTGDVDRVRNISAASDAAASISAVAGRTTTGACISEANSSATITPTRIVPSGANILQGVSAIVAAGREKWEPIVDNDVEGFWTEQSVGSSIWTEQTNNTNIWTKVA